MNSGETCVGPSLGPPTQGCHVVSSHHLSPPCAPAQEEARGMQEVRLAGSAVQSSAGCSVHVSSGLRGPRVGAGCSGPGRLVQAGVGTVCILVWPGHAGAAHGDGEVLLGVDCAAARAGRGPAQDHRGHEHQGAAQPHVLLPARPGQAAPAQAVGLGQVPGEAAGVVGDPAGRGRALKPSSRWPSLCLK